MMNVSSRLGVIACVLAVFAMAANADILFQDDFPYPSGISFNSPSDTSGYTGAVQLDDSEPVTYPTATDSGSSSGAARMSSGYGIIYSGVDPSAPPNDQEILVFKAVSGILAQNITDITFKTYASDPVRFALEVNGAWYVTVTGYAGSSSWPTNTVNASDNWYSLTYDANTLEMGSTPMSLPSGTVGSIGVHVLSGGNRLASRFDDIVINGVPIPEPATMGLLAVGVLAALRRRKR